MLRFVAAIRLSAASPCQVLLVAVRIGFDDEAFAGLGAALDAVASSLVSVDLAAFLVFFTGFLASPSSSSGMLFLFPFDIFACAALSRSSACS
jgi:hypothetical protein